MKKFSVLQKMTLTALLLSLDLIIGRFLSIPITPYVKFSFGISVTIFSSILLGPISGAIIGGGADIFGILIYNSSQNFINPLITISATIMGIFPGLIYMFKEKIKLDDKKSFLVLNILLILIYSGLLTFAILTNEMTLFNNKIIINNTAKIIILIIAFILIIGIDVFAILLNKHFKKKKQVDNSIPSVYLTLFIVLIIEIIFTLFLNTLAKSIMFKISFEIIFFPALLLAFIYIPINTLIVQYLCLLSSKVIVERE